MPFFHSCSSRTARRTSSRIILAVACLPLPRKEIGAS